MRRAPALMLLLLVTGAVAQDASKLSGRELFTDERKGNCAACHKAPNDANVASQSNIGPVLAGVQSRYPDRVKLRAAIWDLSAIKPNTIMPPYGKHRILTEAEIDTLVSYLETI